MKNEMTKKDNPFFLSKKVKMLKFAQRLEASDNEFLKEFSEHLKVTHGGDSQIYYRKRSESDDEGLWHLIPGGEEMKKAYDDLPEYPGDQGILILYDFIEHIYDSLEFHLPSNLNKGCALFGETPFDKLLFTQTFLKVCGGVSYVDEDGASKSFYTIVDCQGKAKEDFGITSYAQKYKDVPFVIFNNCENILNDEYILVAFKHFIEGERSTGLPDGSLYESCYILLGDKNKLQEELEKLNPSAYSSFKERASAFSCFIRVFIFGE